MRRTLARFAVIGSIVTAIDIGVFLALRSRGLVLADVIAVGVASVSSYGLHLSVTFRGDPRRRWLEESGRFTLTSLVALAADVAVLLVVSGSTTPGFRRALAAKVIAVGAAGLLRWTLDRRALFTLVRNEQEPRASRPEPPGTVRLSVVLPAYCEADRIATAVGEMRSALGELEGGVEIVVVDDGSIDGTGDVARGAGADLVVVLPANRGKGAAVRAGVLAASGRTIAFTDADLSYSPEQIPPLLDRVEAGWDVVVGSRKHDATRTLVRARRLREIGGRVVNWLTYSVLLGQYHDTQCGLKAFRSDIGRQIFERARTDGFAFDIEVFVIVERNNLSLDEVPVTVSNTTRSTVHVLRDTARLVRDLFRIRRRAREGRYQLPEDATARR